MQSAATTALPSPARTAPRAAAPADAGQMARHRPAHDTAPRPIPAAFAVAVIDVAAVLGAVLLVTLGPAIARSPHGLVDPLSLTVTLQSIVLLVALAAGVLVIFKAAGLYDATRVGRWRDEMTRVLVATTMLAGGILLFMAANHSNLFEHEALRYAWLASSAAVVAERAARARLTRTPCRRIVIIGSAGRALRLCRDLTADPLTSYQVLGFVDTSTQPSGAFVARRTLGSLEQLESILVGEHVDEVHVALPIRSQYAQIQEAIRVCERVGVKLTYRADIFNLALARPCVVSPTSRVELRVVTEDGAGLFFKRAIDVLGALAGLIALGPLLVATAAAIRITSGSPILFAQERYGLNRRRFRMLKFRTMVQNADMLQASLEARNEAQGPVFKIARDPRVTPLGRWLRRTSFDELPQLINVLRGDMSLVGPRPLPLRDVARFARSADMRRFSARPGITGLWQVSGRSNLDFDRWITLDLQYIDNWSLALDVRILARTIPAVLRGTGAT